MAEKNKNSGLNKKDNSNADLQRWLKAISEHRKADIYLITGGLYEPLDDNVSLCIKKNKQNGNVLLILATYGGNPDVAFRIARCFQANYENFSIFIPSKCKSAGTLLAIGATELIMADNAEFGPLDVQLGKPDELVGVVSGLVPVQALEFLQQHSFDLFEYYLVETVRRSQQTITTKTASEIATKMVIGLFQHVYTQLDPIRLGEYHRDMLVAVKYGERLNEHSNNLKTPEVLNKLSQDYPSHGFVIDKKETKTLFNRVLDPDKDELELMIDSMPIINHLMSNRIGAINPLHALIEKEVESDKNDTKSKGN